MNNSKPYLLEMAETVGDLSELQSQGRTLVDVVEEQGKNIENITGGIPPFMQQSPETEWVIEHEGKPYPSVTIVDSAGNVCIGDVQYITPNKIIVRFNSAFSGIAYFN